MGNDLHMFLVGHLFCHTWVCPVRCYWETSKNPSDQSSQINVRDKLSSCLTVEVKIFWNNTPHFVYEKLVHTGFCQRYNLIHVRWALVGCIIDWDDFGSDSPCWFPFLSLEFIHSLILHTKGQPADDVCLHLFVLLFSLHISLIFLYLRLGGIEVVSVFLLVRLLVLDF